MLRIDCSAEWPLSIDIVSSVEICLYSLKYMLAWILRLFNCIILSWSIQISLDDCKTASTACKKDALHNRGYLMWWSSMPALAASSLSEGTNTTQHFSICIFHAGGQYPCCIVVMLIQQIWTDAFIRSALPDIYNVLTDQQGIVLEIPVAAE